MQNPNDPATSANGNGGSAQGAPGNTTAPGRANQPLYGPGFGQGQPQPGRDPREDISTSAYKKTQGTPQPGGNGGMIADTAGNVITNPDPGSGSDPNTYTPTRYPTDPYGGPRGGVSPSGIPIHVPQGPDPGAGQSVGLPPTFPPVQPTAGPTPYDLYLSRGGRPLTDAQQAAAAQAQQALGADYSHLSNPYSNIASAIQRGNTPDQIARAVQGSRGGYSPYELSASHSGGMEAFNALRGGPGAAMGIYDNGSPQQVAAWRTAVMSNPMMAGRSWGDPSATVATPVPGGGVAVGTPGNAGGGGGGRGEVTTTTIPGRGGTTTTPGYAGGGAGPAVGTPASASMPGKGGAGVTIPARTGRPAWDPNGGMQVGPGGTTGAGDPGNGTTGYGYGGPATRGPSGPAGGQNEGGVPGGGAPNPRGGGGGYRPGGGRDVSQNDSTGGGGGYGGYSGYGYGGQNEGGSGGSGHGGYEETYTTTTKRRPVGGGGGGSAQRQPAPYPYGRS